MKVALAAIGSRGDVLPVVEVGAALARRGHDVRLVVLRDYAPLAAVGGITVCPVAVGSVEAMWPDVAWLRRAALAQPGVMYGVMRTGFARAARSIVDAILAAGDDADLLVAGTATRGAVGALAAARGARSATLLLSPLLPADRPESGVLVPPLGGPLVAAGVSSAMWGMTSSLGSGPAREMRARVGAARPAEELLVSATSPLLSPPSGRLPGARRVVQTGWIRTSGASRLEDSERDDVTGGGERGLPEGLRGFLDAHPGAVLMTFGSCPSADPRADVDLFIRAGRRVGRAVVLQTSALAAGPVADDVWNAPGVAHEALVPQVSAVVHHGGAGTTTSVLAAGRPAAVVPHLGDQGYYARRVHALGVGRHAGPRWRATTAGIARHLDRALTPRIAGRAAVLGEALVAENGADATARVLERWEAGPRSH